MAVQTDGFDFDLWGTNEYRNGEEDESKAAHVQTSPTLKLVDAVTTSEVVQNLERAANLGDMLMDEAAEQQYQEVLGMVPINLMNKSVQAHFIQNNPEYKHAFESRLMRAFLQGISKASFRMCNGIMLAAVARCLLDEVLSQMGLKASARGDLVQLGTELQRRMVGLARKTQEFVETMAMTTKEMGKVATLLEYGGGTEPMLEKMRAISLAIDARSQELKETEDETLEPLIQATVVIQQLLQSDTKFQEEKERLEQRQVKLNEKEAQVVRLYKDFWDQRTQLEASLARRKQELSNIGAMKGIVQRQINRSQNNLRQMDAVIERYEHTKANYQEDHRADLKSANDMVNDLRVAMKNVAQARKKNWEEQLKSLQRQADSYGQQSLSLREASQTASDGVEVIETTSSDSAFFGLWKTSNSSVTTIERPNEKLRLERLANESKRNADELNRQIREMNDRGSGEIAAEMKELMASDYADMQKRAAQERADERLQANVESVNKQIDNLRKLQENIRQTLETHKTSLGQLMGRQEEAVEQSKTFETRLLELKSNEGSLRKEIEIAQGEESDARSEFEAQKKVLAAYAETFGDQNDFAVFMRLFGLLNGSVKNLPIAMETMSSAFKGVELTFGHDIFQENLSSLPEAGQRKMLTDVAVDMQNVCIAAWDTFEAPLSKLIQTETRAVLDPIVRHRRRNQMMASAEKMRDEQAAIEGPSEGPIVEEAE